MQACASWGMTFVSHVTSQLSLRCSIAASMMPPATMNAIAIAASGQTGTRLASTVEVFQNCEPSAKSNGWRGRFRGEIRVLQAGAGKLLHMLHMGTVAETHHAVRNAPSFLNRFDCACGPAL